MKVSKTREMLKEQYLNSLKEDKIPWRAGWRKINLYNGVSKHIYRGINKLLLQYISNQRGYEDPRFFTFNQVKSMGLHLNSTAKGKGIPVEFWSLYDKEMKKTLSFADYERIKDKEPERAADITWMVRNYYVFNGIHVDGLPALDLSPQTELKESSQKIFVETMIKNMGVKVIEVKGNDKAYYIPSEDKIVLPSYNSFFTDEDYYATILHELAHATGHESRFNRDIENVYGSVEYAKEELRAEISSSFVCSDLEIVSDVVVDNHKAYIQAWIELIEDQEKELFCAINDAEKISAFMEEKGNFNILNREINEKESVCSFEQKEKHTKVDEKKEREQMSVKNKKRIEYIEI